MVSAVLSARTEAHCTAAPVVAKQTTTSTDTNMTN